MADDDIEEGEPKPRKKRPREDDYDDEDDDDDRPRRRKIKKSDDPVASVIPYKNGMALAAYYTGIFGLITCLFGLGIFGIVPIVLGILGLKKAKEDPGAHGTAHAWTGIILGGIQLLGCGMLVVFVIATGMGNKR